MTWRPTTEYVESANVTRLMRRLGVDSIDTLRRRSVEEPEWFWDAVVADLGLPFARPYTRVLDDTRGIAWSRWFVDGRVNIAAACVDRWRDDPARADRAAVVCEEEGGAVRELSYRELAEQVDRLAAALRARGIGPGDAIGVFMPMVPEAVVAAYAIMKVGAIYVPLFSGFGAGAIAARLQQADIKLVFTVDGTWRRGKFRPMKEACDAAVSEAPSVSCVVVLRRGSGDVAMTAGRDVTWEEFTAAARAEDGRDAAETDSEDTCLLAFTSGTTGEAKGVVHVHGGFLVKIASEAAYQLDVRPGRTFHWVTDMGWLMGPFTMVGAHAVGATMLLYDGAPDFPDPGRLWSSVERHRIDVLGVSPTLIRALRSAGVDWVRRHDLSSLRILGSTGEPWNPEPYAWLAREVGGGRLPIINISGGTEIGCCLLSPYPVEEIAPCSVGGASLGIDVDVFDAAGHSIRSQVGELVCKRPWPSMTRGLWRDPERYLESYWSTYDGVWRHGDWAEVDEAGRWYLYGRSDEALNVAGKRIGPAEVESILVADAGVTEAAAIGVPDDTKGEAIWCFWVPADPSGEDHSEDLRGLVAEQLGSSFRPARVVRVRALPRTRSAKIMRRALRATVVGIDPGDLSGAENPEALSDIRSLLT